MILSETFQVAVIIKKLPSKWKDFKNYFKHKRKEMNFELKKDNKGLEKKWFNPANAKTNVLELGQSSKNKKNKPKLGPKGRA